MVSYPTGVGPDKALQLPDLPVLALLAEEAQVDLRVLVLTRSPFEVLVSATQHRSFGQSPAREAVILSDMAAILAAQVQFVDPKFVLCAPFDRLRDVDWWTGSAAGPGRAMPPTSFLHPRLNAALEAMLGAVATPNQSIANTSSRSLSYSRSPPEALTPIFLSLLGQMTQLLEQVARCPLHF